MSTDSNDYTWRPITPGDVEAWTALHAVITEADEDGDHVSAETVAELFGNAYIDFPRGSYAAFDGSSAGSPMVAYCYLRARTEAEPVHEMWMLGGVHPAHRGRGLGTGLLEWVDRASVPLHEERFPGRPLSISGSSLTRRGGATELFIAQGYQQARWFNEMVLDLAEFEPSAQSSPPAGVEFVPYSAQRSEHARLVRNESFQDHWGSTTSTPESWRAVVHGSAFRAEFTYLAYQNGDPLALVLAEEHVARFEATGRRDLHIALVGTRRIGRKRGLATSLLTHVLELGRADGFDSASLAVDADSPTGAFGLYERIGFHPENTWIAQLKPLIAPSV